MITFYKKSSKTASFKIDSPPFSIPSSSQDLEALLKNAGVDYKVVTNGYITFSGQVFDSTVSLMIGIHFSLSEVKYIEIFRPSEYYQSEDYDIDASFSELSQILQNKYGKPLTTTSASISNSPCEQWITPDYVVNHYILDRFGPEEHLHINFYQGNN